MKKYITIEIVIIILNIIMCITTGIILKNIAYFATTIWCLTCLSMLMLLKLKEETIELQDKIIEGLVRIIKSEEK